ncbi:MAG: CvpA family protein, partial [Pseudomonadota bacterium]
FVEFRKERSARHAQSRHCRHEGGRRNARNDLPVWQETPEDRLIGGFFGFARGMLIVLIMVLVAGLTPLPRQQVWTEAMLSPPLEAMAGALKPWLPAAVSRYLSYD